MAVEQTHSRNHPGRREHQHPCSRYRRPWRPWRRFKSWRQSLFSGYLALIVLHLQFLREYRWERLIITISCHKFDEAYSSAFKPRNWRCGPGRIFLVLSIFHVGRQRFHSSASWHRGLWHHIKRISGNGSRQSKRILRRSRAEKSNSPPFKIFLQRERLLHHGEASDLGRQPVEPRQVRHQFSTSRICWAGHDT